LHDGLYCLFGLVELDVGADGIGGDAVGRFYQLVLRLRVFALALDLLRCLDFSCDLDIGRERLDEEFVELMRAEQIDVLFVLLQILREQFGLLVDKAEEGDVAFGDEVLLGQDDD
jgi:hypothetical protein